MKHPSSRQLFEYWNVQRGLRLAPERNDIEPGPIRRALSDTFILGRDAGGTYRFRLAGTRLCALFGRELKGSDFLSLWAEAERPAMQKRLAAVTGESASFVAGASGHVAGAPAAELELLLLPLRHRDRSQVRLIGVLGPLVSPYWLGSKSVDALTSGTVRHLGPGARLATAPRLVAGADGRLHGGLVVYDGGRS